MHAEPKLSLPYQMENQQLVIGPYALTFKVIKNLDDAIDLLCRHLQEDPQMDGGHLFKRVFAEELCPYFGRLWPAAIGLCNFLLKDSTLSGLKVLEIGCGLGLPAIVLAKLGAHVTATDFHPDVEILLKHNMSLNDIGLDYARLHWSHSEAAEGLCKFPLVIGSDILYEGKHPEEVAEALAKLVQPGGRLIIADQGRGQLQRFVTIMENVGFSCQIHIEKMDLDCRQLGIENKDIFILQFSSMASRLA